MILRLLTTDLFFAVRSIITNLILRFSLPRPIHAGIEVGLELFLFIGGPSMELSWSSSLQRL